MSNMSTIGPLMVDIGGTSLDAEDREILMHPQVGGVILFARNYADSDQLRALCAGLAALKSPRLLIAVDHEGGRVQRFRVGFTRVPAMRTLGCLYEESPERALTQAQEYGATIGTELAATGIDLCFAPVLDRDGGVSKVIGDRAFAETPELIVPLARAFRAGLNRAGLAATGKHFPGHGTVAVDSHEDLPVDRRSWTEIESRDLVPFKTLIEDGIESLMTAHVRYAAVDEKPASFSRHWLRGVLRNQLHYNGALFCDDLSMGAAKTVGNLLERARMALDAGCDMLPVCNDRAGVVALLDELSVKPCRLASARLWCLYRTEGPR